MYAIIEAPIPNAPEGKYISQIPSPNNLLTIASAIKSIDPTAVITLYQFLRERNPPLVKSETIIYNLGEATCMDYFYNYAIKYLKVLRAFNPGSKIYLTGYHAWLHKAEFKDFILTTPYTFENDIINKTDYVEWHNAWELNDWDFMKKYVCSATRGMRATIRASRGCVHFCGMCPVPIVYNQPQNLMRYSVGWVMQEVDTLYNKYGIREIGFLDDNLFADRKWGKQLLQTLIAKNYKSLRFTFEEGLTVPQAMDEELVSLLKQAKFYHIKLGIEALDKETLDFIQKPYRDPEMAVSAIKMLQKYKMNPTCFICIGFPTNTEEKIRADIKRLIELKVKLRVQVLWAYPGVECANKTAIPQEVLKKLQQEAMQATGSCAWRKK